ncbi:hypothetical protein NEMBOFW57_010028 [Staphylotrichum longicolle]|uniref:Uncharacterized protein n=1 Tax=Staphylotrichum longicolle TaxID=669026 RepID=A0AAD4EQ24_9PEZI|nr:hypothetical protein NEMBOFW57_010028 [Staphylotrichum longicolle]
MAPTTDDLQPPKSVASKLTAWGSNPSHGLPPLLIFSSYLTLAGFKIDGAGMTAAWSGVYALLALRRRPASLRNPLLPARRGARHGHGPGRRQHPGGRAEEEERRELNRWGVYKD